jgi:hypothetical protein
MTKYEARVKTRFGEIVVNFDSIEDLKTSIDNLDADAVSDAVTKKFEAIIQKEVRQPKPGFEEIYRFTPSGMVELIGIPDNKAKTVALVVYAYHPEPASIEQISLSSGIKDVVDYLTHASYKKYWSKVQDGKYVLSQEGLEWVTTKIVDEFKVAEEEAQSKSA